MALRSRLSVAIMSAVFVSQLILQIDAQTGAARTSRDITFDCDPDQLDGAATLTCLARRFEEGRRLFDEETFQGNGRTCVTCHSVTTGTFSPEDAQKRLAANPSDPLFVGDGLDDGIFGGLPSTRPSASISRCLPASGSRTIRPRRPLRSSGGHRRRAIDNSSKTLEEVAEQYTFMFRLFAGITLTPQDEADIVAFLMLL